MHQRPRKHPEERFEGAGGIVVPPPKLNRTSYQCAESECSSRARTQSVQLPLGGFSGYGWLVTCCRVPHYSRARLHPKLWSVRKRISSFGVVLEPSGVYVPLNPLCGSVSVL